jgi:Domain of unknown function (DUF4082)/Phage tail protein (Tail_P2_I)
MFDLKEAIESTRPLLNSLPGRFADYRQGPVGDFLTDYWDKLFIGTYARYQQFLSKDLNPGVCDAKWLDYLAPMYGFSGEYWNPIWTVAQKRAMLLAANSEIWPILGTPYPIFTILNIFGITHSADFGSIFILDDSLQGLLDESLMGEIGDTAYIILPETYALDSVEYKFTELVVRLYSPVGADVQVVYSQFYLDLSALDVQPLFPVSGSSVVATAESVFGEGSYAYNSVSGPNNFALGQRFRALVAGSLTSVKLYRDISLGAVSRTVRVWDKTNTLIATLTFPGVALSGWQTVALPTPLAAVAGDEWTLSLDGNSGWAQTNSPASSVTSLTNKLLLLPGSADYGNPANFPGLANDQHWGLDSLFI